MEAEPLPRKIFDELKRQSIAELELQFSGGSDVGYLTVQFKDESGQIMDGDFDEFKEQVENWAWEVYDYSGAGCGSDFGDNIAYNVENNTVKTASWETTIKEWPPGEEDLTISE